MKSTPDSERRTLNVHPTIELHVEELVLHGFAGGDRYTISDAVERELAFLLTNKIPMRSESSAEVFLDGGEIHLRPGFSARQLGKEIGRRVFAGLIRPAHNDFHRNRQHKPTRKDNNYADT